MLQAVPAPSSTEACQPQEETSLCAVTSVFVSSSQSDGDSTVFGEQSHSTDANAQTAYAQTDRKQPLTVEVHTGHPFAIRNPVSADPEDKKRKLAQSKLEDSAGQLASSTVCQLAKG